MKLINKIRQVETIVTCHLEKDGKKLTLVEWEDESGKVIDSVLREKETGDEIYDDKLLEEAQEFSDKR